MSCPICGAHCRCSQRGPGGLCCSCHRHAVRKLIITQSADPALEGSISLHEQWMRETAERDANGGQRAPTRLQLIALSLPCRRKGCGAAPGKHCKNRRLPHRCRYNDAHRRLSDQAKIEQWEKRYGHQELQH